VENGACHEWVGYSVYELLPKQQVMSLLSRELLQTFLQPNQTQLTK